MRAHTSISNWVIRCDTRAFPLARPSGHAPARSTVLARENAAGAIEIRYRGRLLHWSEIPAPPGRTPPPALRPSGPPPSVTPGRRRGGQSADHPWHQAVTDHYTYQQRAKDRRAWVRAPP